MYESQIVCGLKTPTLKGECEERERERKGECEKEEESGFLKTQNLKGDMNWKGESEERESFFEDPDPEG